MTFSHHLRPARLRSIALLLIAVASTVNAQQGVLVNGNSQLPSCAQSCQLLQQAATACSGLTSANQGTWICFCQSAYLTNLFKSDAGICDSVCTSASDSQQVSTWYKSNCGSDHGASEHPDSGSTPATTTVGVPSTSTASAVPGSTTTPAASTSASLGRSWLNTHWQWIIMLVVLAVGLPAFAFLMIWLKKRRQRKRDMINGVFNSGITSRNPHMSEGGGGAGHHVVPPILGTMMPHGNDSFGSAGMDHTDTGHHSPRSYHSAGDRSPPISPHIGLAVAGGPSSSTPSVAASSRNPDAYMPYGDGWTRSESRLGYQADRGSSLPLGADLEKIQAVVNTKRVESPKPHSRSESRSSRRKGQRQLMSERSWRPSMDGM